MPPRWVSAAILLAWITSAVWLFRLEIWPSLEPNAPPPFTIDLVDEAQKEKLPIRWVVKQDGKRAFIARTAVEHRPKENDFTLRAVFEPSLPDPTSKRAGELIHLQRMSSANRVDPDGRLLSLEVELHFDAPKFLDVEARPDAEARPGAEARPDAEARLWGEVSNGKFESHFEIKHKSLPNGKITLSPSPIPVSSQGSVVMPLHPVNRISGLKKGQAWRVPVFDPVADALASLTGGEARVRYLRAKVRPQSETLEWQRSEVPCLIIDYEEENASKEDKMTAETWVSEVDGRVLKQVANLSGVEWVIERE